MLASDPRRYIILHGHFYQPPRENPWNEEVESQDSAAPYHDWNERIAAECYGPNSAARIVGAYGGVTSIINNYTHISFNVGPTLMTWLERAAPATYGKILEADRLSAEARGGHGNAIAQTYNHMIMPLASRRDRRTQIRWGIADFVHRFGRRPSGMWMPECAVDDESLLELEGEGIAFTVLAPQQARRFRGPQDAPWQDGIDPRRPYRIELPGGRSLAVFFYDGPVAHDIAFGRAMYDSDSLVGRIMAAFGDTSTDPDAPWLVNVATDGETFGHHRPFGDMTLAAALARLEADPSIRLTNYAQYLELHPPEHTAVLHSPSSWSCAHGVARWREDCGCTTGAQPGWNQKWRRPLRDALDDLRERLAEIFERVGAGVFRDPWAARDAYVEVVRDRAPETLDRFLERHAGRRLDGLGRVQALKLLEMQRHAMLMFTSCGWFFAELSGPEGTQILKYAARAIQLAREIDGTNLEAAFHAALARAPSNIAEFGDGARVLDRLVRPSVVNLGGVVAHFAVSSLFEHYAPRGRIFCYRYEADDFVRRSRGTTTLCVGHVRLASEITHEMADASFAVLHFGGHDVRCAVGTFIDPPTYEDMRAELESLFELKSIGDVVRAIDRHSTGRQYALADLFLDERHKIIRVLVADILTRHRQQLFGVYEENRPLLRFLVETGAPVPGPLRGAADYALSQRFVELVAEARFGTPRFDAVRAELLHVREEAAAVAATLDSAGARRILEQRILEEARVLAATPRRATARALLAYLEIAESLGLTPNLWETQNLFWTLIRDDLRGPELDVDLVMRLGVRLGFDERAIRQRWREAEATVAPIAAAHASAATSSSTPTPELG